MNCTVPMQVTRFCKTLFWCAIGVCSHHGSVMIAGMLQDLMTPEDASRMAQALYDAADPVSR